MPDLLGDALVPAAVEMDLSGGPDQHTDRCERTGTRHPKLRCTGDVPDVGLASEHQDVEVVGLHLRERPLTPPGAQSQVVRQDLLGHQCCPYGA